MNKKCDIPNLTDKDYYFLSQNTYSTEKMKEAFKEKTPIESKSNKAYYVDKIKRDSDTGLDAYVFVQAKKKNGKWVKPDTPENVVVAFAGTDPKNQFFQDVIDADGGNVVAGFDPKKKEHYIIEKDTSKTIGKYNATPSQDAMLSSGNYKLITKTSQIGQADDLVREVKQKYKGTSTIVSTTGHSLGGAEAEYSAVNNDIYAVAFNNPSVVKLHSEEKQKAIRSGKYNSYVKAIVNPDDMTGSGWWFEYERHAGRTIYTKDPSVARAERQIRLDPRVNGGIFGTVLGVATDYITITVMGMPDTHGLNDSNFTFDEDGNVQNVEGDELVYDKNLKAMLPAEVASGSGAIKVTPEVAKQLAEKVNAIINDLRTMKREAENAYQEHDSAISDLKYDTYRQVGHGLYDLLTLDDVNNTLNDLAQSFDKKGNPLFYDVDAEAAYIASLQDTILDLEEISGYLSQIAKDFKSKDKMLARWLKL
ncbi:lipase [Bacillus sp. FSL M8-0168]|uniref:lipase n=1 Tax=Bacillus sp. FSL M8-0168 TaxID=2921614 RepID=UPI0030FD4DC7